MITLLSQEDIQTYIQALQGERTFIGWGVRNGLPFDRWQEQWPVSRFVDSNIRLWDTRIDGYDVLNPMALRDYDPARHAVLNYYQMDIVNDYVKRISQIPCLRPMALQHVLREIHLAENQAAASTVNGVNPLGETELLALQKGLIPHIGTLQDTSSLQQEGIYKTLHTYDWTDCVAGLLQAIPRHDFKNNAVALITNSLYPGGAERQLVNCAVGFKKKGWHTHVLAAVSDHTTPHYLQVLHDHGVPYNCVSDTVTPQNARQQALELLNSVAEEVRLALWHLPHDILFQTACTIRYLQKIKPRLVITYLDWSNSIGALAAVLCGVPEIIISGRNYPPTHFPHFFEKTSPTFYNVYQVLAHCPSVHFTNNAPHAGDSYAKWLGFEKSKIAFIPNCLTESFIKPPTAKRMESFCAQNGIKKKNKVVLGVFRLAHEKRPDKFVTILAQLIKADQNVKGIICGVGPLLPELQAQAQKLKIADRITFIGLSDSIAEFMCAADILLHTAEFEGMPNAIIEAQSQALPVVCTKSGGIEECLAPDLLPYAFANTDFAGVTQAALKLLKHPALRKKLGLAAQKHVRKEHALTKLVERNLALTQFATKRRTHQQKD